MDTRLNLRIGWASLLLRAQFSAVPLLIVARVFGDTSRRLSEPRRLMVCGAARHFAMAVVLAIVVLSATTSGADAQAHDCRWIGDGEALLCVYAPTGLATLSTWQGGAWVSVPAGAGFTLPAALGGLSTYGRSYPPSGVTPAIGAYSHYSSGNTLAQTGVLYGPGATSHPTTCTTWYSGYAGATAYQVCR